ncbi:MAG: hypothetical protein GF355_06915 [Candidatus Eisenbacteria bacterium]|nr:hypothetical protein [Candidatus Eisenbacteria bacterium]
MRWRTQRGPGFLALILSLLLCGPAGSQAENVESKVDMKLWGRAKFDVHFDTGRQLSNVDFMNYMVSEDDEELNFMPRDTRFGFSAATTKGDWTHKAVFEIDFYGGQAGNNLLPRMRLGYADMAHSSGFSLRAGQDWIPIAQQNPPTLDFGVLSWAGNLWWRVPQVTARYKLENGVELLAGAMKHRIRDNLPVDQEELLPWMMGRVAYTGFLDGKGLVAVGAGVRPVTIPFTAFDADTTAVDIDFAPFLVAGELSLPIGDQLSVKAEAYMGRGLGEEFVHYGFEYNPYHPEDEAADEGRAIASMGGFASLTFRPAKKTTLNAGFGMDDPDDDDMKVSEGALLSVPYYRNTVVFGNVQQKLSANLGVGFELIHFITEHAKSAAAKEEDDIETEEIAGQRVTLSMFYKF